MFGIEIDLLRKTNVVKVKASTTSHEHYSQHRGDASWKIEKSLKREIGKIPGAKNVGVFYTGDSLSIEITVKEGASFRAVAHGAVEVVRRFIGDENIGPEDWYNHPVVGPSGPIAA